MWRIYRLGLWFLLSLFLIHLGATHIAYAQETKFIITAYYSPLRGQSNYFHGTFEREIHVNGKWTNGASGAEVFEWMLAAPRNYPFWTKIYFEGYGIGEVQDRGWAIVEAGERGHAYDRIDIWMWHGDAGLQRAKKWWRREITWQIVSSQNQNTIMFGEDPTGEIGSLKVTPESGSEDIEKLQQIFQKVELYSGEINWNYEDIKDALIEFQVSSGVLPSKNHEEAWYFGRKTTRALQKIYPIISPLVQESEIQLQDFSAESLWPEQELLFEYGKLEVTPESDASDIRDLQTLLSGIKQYSGKIDGKYSSIEQPLIELQKKLDIIENDDDWWAGYFGSKTKSALLEYYTTRALQEKETLSTAAKKRLDATIITLKRVIEVQAQKKNKTPESITTKLIKDIQEVIPNIKKQSLRDKLLYIAENL